jgi:hypothetical protein
VSAFEPYIACERHRAVIRDPYWVTVDPSFSVGCEVCARQAVAVDYVPRRTFEDPHENANEAAKR